MPIILRSIKLPPDYSDAILTAAAISAGIDESRLADVRLYKRSLDARGRPPWYVVQIAVRLKGGKNEEKNVLAAIRSHGVDAVFDDLSPLPDPVPGKQPLRGAVIVIGAGPAGLQAALRLARAGYRPIILERGKSIKPRGIDVQIYRNLGILNENSNVVFGLGGAGAYSDGKIGTRNHSPYIREVYASWVAAGAPAHIAADAKPHLGTDKLHHLVANLQRTIESLGGEFRFESKVDTIDIEPVSDSTPRRWAFKPGVPNLVKTRWPVPTAYAGRVKSVVVNGQHIDAGTVILTPGSSARDLLVNLHHAGVYMIPRDAKAGFRIEHPQALIDRAMLGTARDDYPSIGAADYFLKNKPTASTRSAHTFCVCPGGMVISLASEPNGVCTNGMSSSARAGAFINGAVIAPVKYEEFLAFAAQVGELPAPDYSDDDAMLFAGFTFQRAFERLAYQLGGGDYLLPAMRADDFLENRPPSGLPDTAMPAWANPADLRNALPPDILNALANGLKTFSRRIRGFSGKDATLYGSELRSGAVVQLPRDDTGVSLSIDGVYPAGEGAGYAGGITTSAADGMLAADRVISRYAQPK